MTQPIFSEADYLYMSEALNLAKKAMALDEIPVGALIVRGDEVLGRGLNMPLTSKDPTHHAEIAAIRDASKNAHNYRLPGTILYVTLEPCTMCFGALIHARIEQIIYAAQEPRAGVIESRLKLPEALFYNHRIAVKGGLLENESRELLQSFFQKRRGLVSRDGCL